MLFNTLAYAKFFAFVFVLAWMLVRPRYGVLLPWVAVLGFTLFNPSLLGLGVSLLALTFTLPLARGNPDEPVGARAAALALLVNLAGLWVLTSRHAGFDPATVSLTAIGVPEAQVHRIWFVWLGLGMVVAFFTIKAKKVRLVFILFASYVFYAHWDWRFLFLIFGSSTADWLLGNAIAKASNPRTKRMWLAGTVVVNLGVLSIFKYAQFAVDSVARVLLAFGIEVSREPLGILLPIGISFFTFESMSYVIDVYRGQIKPQKSYLEYLSFVAFFPHLVAGPIVRPRDLLPQLAGPPRFSSQEASEGMFLIALGLVKKVAIGDYLALNLVDRVFDAPLQYSAVECYAAVLGYAVQIYCDFSGYTDIAIGCALLLGVRFPLNFNAPYKAKNVVDFWRRWHISLSTWLRDYLYIPLGGNRKGQARTYLNLMITMLLGGLWHGAAWNFVAWGGLHGVALAVTRFWHNWRGSQTQAGRRYAVLYTLFTFHFVCLCWIFFRADGFDRAQLVLSQLSTLTTHHQNLPWPVLAILTVGLVSHFVPERWYEGSRRGFIALPAPAQGMALFCAALALRKMASADAVPFVYFQF